MQLLEGHLPISPPRGASVWDIDPYAEETLSNLEDYYSELRARGRFVYFPRYALLGCGRYHETKQVFSDWKGFVSSRGVGLTDFKHADPWRAPSIILEVDPPYHDKTRRVLVRALSPGAIDSLKQRFRQAAEKLVEELLEKGTFDAVTDLACLAQYPEEFVKLKADPTLARATFEETLRLTSPIHTFCRTASSPAQVSGIDIPQDAKILCVLGAANLDPEHWSSPDRFDVARKNRDHLAFGVGIHGCVGQAVARAEAEALLSTIARQVATIELSGKPAWRPGNAIHALDKLPISIRAS